PFRRIPLQVHAAFVKEAGLKAPLANATASNTNEVLHLSGRYEIVSLVGTLNPDAHLHVCLADAEGGTVGGHVLGGLERTQLQFERELDEQTGFPELVFQRR
uniref:PPC domain-containing protein n=1 Tax=Labrus bergylta TaxID=56723 RepID=A0A3Q3LFC5_9LABR